jgi:hypothetical protein
MIRKKRRKNQILLPYEKDFIKEYPTAIIILKPKRRRR